MKTVAIDSADVEFLRTIARSLNHQIRLLFNPAPTRLRPDNKPTQVTVVAEEEAFVDYTLYELEKFRTSRSSTAKAAEPLLTF